MHITEHTGRGVPKITEVYGRENIHFNENSIVVSIPFDRLENDFTASEDNQNTSDVSPTDGTSSLATDPVDTSSSSINISDRVQDNESKLSYEEQILLICEEPKGIWEIADCLGFHQKKSVRKYLNPLIEQGRIARTIPKSPSSRFQKYITIK